ncbi:MAG: hypothetical protein QXX74_02260 [Candidatus Micrarchaeaceae archaeon]
MQSKSVVLFTIIILFAIIIVLVLVLALQYYQSMQNNKALANASANYTTYAELNLNSSEINRLIAIVGYNGIKVDSVVEAPNSTAYRLISVSFFQEEGDPANHTSLPIYIISTLYIMRSQAAASSAYPNMFYSGNANQTISNYTFAYGDITTAVHIIKSVAVLHTSIFNATNIEKYGYPMSPDFQLESLFIYRNVIGSVTTYSIYPELNDSAVISLTNYLIRKLIAANSL